VIAEPPACARTARVYELLLAVPKVGPAKATRWLSHCRIAPSKTVVGLSERQRRELLELLALLSWFVGGESYRCRRMVGVEYGMSCAAATR
jgi:hypothetical protein